MLPPHVVPSMSFSLLLNTKEDIWKNVGDHAERELYNINHLK